MNISWLYCWDWYLKFKTFKFINTMILHSLILKVGKHKMGRVRGVKKMKKIREKKRIKAVKGVEETIAEIK